MKYLIQTTNVDDVVNHTIAKYIANNISIAKSYNKSIGNLIDNSKMGVKSFDIHSPPLCSCHIIKQLGRGVGKSLGHLWIQAIDIEDSNFKEVCIIATSSIPSPTNGKGYRSNIWKTNIRYD